MLKCCLASFLVAAALVLSWVGVQQPVRAQEETCIMTVVCNVTPTESTCVHMKVCFGGG